MTPQPVDSSMSARILIVETTARQRSVLCSRLEAAHYTVQTAADLSEVSARLTDDPPDLLLLDIAADPQAALALCAALRDHAAEPVLPVIALACRPGTDQRLAALRAGADDILDKEGDAAYLLARIRSLLRVRDASADLGLRGGTARALGMAESALGFVPAGRTAIMTRRAADLPPALTALAARLPGGALMIDPAEDIAAATEGAGGARADLFVIDHVPLAPGQGDAADLCRLIADLQSRPRTRLARTLVLIPASTAPGLSGLALDLGVDDVVTDTTSPEELAHRVRALVRRKSRSDRLRDTLQSGIAAALTDPLTGLHNRRYAMAEIAALAERKARGGGDYAVVMFDIDHFKQINDGFGHAAGDMVLREVARILRSNLRARDMLARIGGEEFLVAMPDTRVDTALTVADRLRRLVADTVIDGSLTGSDQPLRVTLSAGVAAGAACIDAADPLDLVMKSADRALYAAKSAGRNQVTVADAAT